MKKTYHFPETALAAHAAIQAGEILEKGFRSNFVISAKEGKHNLVTEYDLASEKILLSLIQKNFPGDFILSEECGKISGKNSKRRWIIDPLDGTVNFAHGIPIFAVSIGLEEEGELKVGVIYQPLTKELFVAEKDHGATLNQKTIQVTKVTSLDASILATGFPYNLIENPNHCIDHFTDILKRGIPVRRLGAATIDLAYVACGIFDGFFEVVLAPWDCAAGILLITEAGGKVSCWDGSPFTHESYKPFLATNQKIHQELSTVLSKSI